MEDPLHLIIRDFRQQLDATRKVRDEALADRETVLAKLITDADAALKQSP